MDNIPFQLACILERYFPGWQEQKLDELDPYMSDDGFLFCVHGLLIQDMVAVSEEGDVGLLPHRNMRHERVNLKLYAAYSGRFKIGQCKDCGTIYWH